MMGYNLFFSALAWSILAAFPVFAQSGSYTPANADYSFPRTLVNRGDLPNVRSSLFQQDKMPLYVSSWINANEPIPVGNVEYSDRAKRSYLAKEAAFVLLMKLKPQSNTLVFLSSADSAVLAKKVINLLENMNDTVKTRDLPSYTYYFPWQFSAKELNNYLVAYDFLRGANVPEAALSNARAKLQSHVGHLCEKTQTLYVDPYTGQPILNFFEQQVNNHGVMMSTVLGLAAIVLNDMDSADDNFKPNRWMNIAVWNLDHIMWRSAFPFPHLSDTSSIAGYSEGTSYFNYAFDNAMPFFRTMWNFLPDGYHTYIYGGNTQKVRHPWYDPNYKKLAQWMKAIRMPNGAYPAIHDSPNLKTNVTALFGLPEYNIAYPGISYSDYKVQYLCTNVAQGIYQDSLFQTLPDAGSAVFRTAYNEPSAIYMHLIAKNGLALLGAQGHHQGDATSFELFYNNEIMALDPGYPGAPYRQATAQPTNHNLVLVNGKGPDAPTLDFVNPNNITFIEKPFSIPSALDYTELRSGWHEAKLLRRVLFPHRRYFIVSDYMMSGNENQYTFQLHGNGLLNANPASAEGSFQPNYNQNKGVYARNSTLLYAQVTGTSPCTHVTALDSAAIGDNTYRYHSKWLANQTADTAAFVAILFPKKDDAQPLITDISANIGRNASYIEAEGKKDIVVAQARRSTWQLNTNLVPFPKSIGTDGLLLWSTAVSKDDFSVFAQQATKVFSDSALLWQAASPVNIFWRANTSGDYEGYVSDSATVLFYTLNTRLVPATGYEANIESYEYQASTGATLIKFAAPTYFRFESVPVRTVESTGHTSGVVIAPNPAQSEIRISWEDTTAGVADIQVFNAQGALLQTAETPVTAGLNEYKLQLAGYPAGIYLLQLKTGRKVLRSFWVKN